ncbi:MAG: 30S ribosomal protein S12 methylthiotransferase RimO [candidate division KSB1 bacterium]|nr:30S ribosomal protein S12 methylthiotransferase RimO [candidate division KSB1 bacterium]
MKIAVVPLGCPKNTVDLEWVLGALLGPGVQLVSRARTADAVIVHTCAFIRPAVEEAIETIVEVSRLKEAGKAKVIVTGCLPQRFGRRVAALLPAVDLVVSEREPRRIAARVRGLLGLPASPCSAERWSLGPAHYAYLKIAEGCDNRCAYCTIPIIKGKYRSRPIEAIAKEARGLAERGVQELIVVAQDTTYFGGETGGASSLPALLRALSSIDGPRWIRLMYTHPARVDDRLIEVLAEEERLCKYLDIPIQHASDRILAAMGRRTTRAQLEQVLQRLRDRIPGLALRSTVMVGFPGETEEDFQTLLDFLQDARFEHLGVFTYYPEQGTRAARMPGQLSDEEKQLRHAEVLDLQARLSAARTAAMVGKTVQVLVDEADAATSLSLGRTEWDAPDVDCQVHIQGAMEPGTFRAVHITDSDGFDLYGTPATHEGRSARSGCHRHSKVPRELSRV